MTHFDNLELLRRPEKWKKIKGDPDRGYPKKEEVIQVLEEMIPQAQSFLKELKSGEDKHL